jgi:hypothetical protein
MLMVPRSVNLLAAHEVQKRLPQPHLIGMHCSHVGGAMDCNLVRVLCR